MKKLKQLFAADFWKFEAPSNFPWIYNH